MSGALTVAVAGGGYGGGTDGSSGAGGDGGSGGGTSGTAPMALQVVLAIPQEQHLHKVRWWSYIITPTSVAVAAVVKAPSDKINVPMGGCWRSCSITSNIPQSKISTQSNGGGLGAPGPGSTYFWVAAEAAAVLDQALSVKVVLMMDHL